MDKARAASSSTIVEEKPNISNPATTSTAINSAPKPPNDSATEQVRVVPFEEGKQAALSLAAAFKDDEVARYFIDVPDREHWTEEQKWALHCEILEYITYAHCLKGLVTTIGADYGAVALW